MSDELQIGTIIDGYEVISKIGHGGMAEIYQVQHQESQQICALKLLLSSSQEASLQIRFEQEFKALSKLEHPNVLKVLECGQYLNRPYFTMELLKGKTLKDSIPEWQNLPSSERFEKTRRILLQMANALDHIHQRGWIHRDVTPSNIMLLDNDLIKLMDFGVVKIPGMDQTKMGEVIGTVTYMSPEQIKNQHVDPRADLYSLGATLYLMLTGKRPFNAMSLAGYLKKHLTDIPDQPSSYYPMIPKDLEDTCMRLLEKDPNNRFASANHLLKYLSHSSKQDKDRRLFGRTKEIHQLHEKIASLVNQHHGVIVLEGRNGMGRSKLLHAASNTLSYFDMPYTFCNNHNPNQPMYSAFQNLLTELPNSTREAHLSKNQDNSWEFFTQIRGHLDQPRAILFDNIEKADAGSSMLLEFLISSSFEEKLPILFIITKDSESESDTLSNILHQHNHPIPVHKIQVEELFPAAVEEWLLTLALNDKKIPIMAEHLHKASEGVPLILEEMIRTLFQKKIIHPNQRIPLQISEEEIPNIDLPLPESIHMTFQNRLETLPLLEREIIEILCVAQRSIPEGLLLETLQLLQRYQNSPNQLHILELKTALKKLEELDIIQSHDIDSQCHLEPAHMWIRNVLNPQIIGRNLVLYHTCLGRILERYHQRNISAVVETLAYHFAHTNLYGKAFSYLCLASNKLKLSSLFHQAKQYLDQAIKIEPKTREHLTLYDANERLAELYLSYASISYRLSDMPQAQKAAQKADEIACEQQNNTLLAKVATEKAYQARDLYNLGEADLQIRRALRYADLSGQPGLSILPLYELGALMWEQGKPAEAQVHFKEALNISEQVHDAFGIAKVNNGLGVLSMSMGDTTNARHNFGESIAYSTKNKRIEDLVVAQTNLSELYHCIGYFNKSLQLLNKTIKDCREFRYQLGLSIALRHRAILLTDLGRYTEAQEHAQMALELNEEQHNQQEYLATLVSWLRCHFATENWEQITTLLPIAQKLLKQFDAEGYAPILFAWKARMLAQVKQDHTQAKILLTQAEQLVKDNRKFQEVRCYLNIARGWMVCQTPLKAIFFAEKALSIANECGYRYYSMRARQLLYILVEDELERKRHKRVGEALARSLASALSTVDSQSFLKRNSID